MTTYCYMRVSSKSDRQSHDSQRKALQDYCRLHHIHKPVFLADRATGRNDRRPQWQYIINNIQQGDVIIAHRIDRVSRSPIDLFALMQLMLKRNCTLIITENNLILQGNNPMNEFLIGLFGLLAKWESDLISARTRSGLAVAKSKGIKLGARPNRARRNRVTRLLRNHSLSETAKILNVSVPSIHAMRKRIMAA